MMHKETLETYIEQNNSTNKYSKKLLKDIITDIEKLHNTMSARGGQIGYHMHPNLLNKPLKLMGYNIMTRLFIKKRLERGEHWRGIYYIRKEELDKNYKEAWRE